MRLDIVLPAHNEQHRINETLTAYRREIPSEDRGIDAHFIVALDDCCDATADVVARHVAADPRVHVTSYPRLGKGGVISEAFRRADAELIAFVDADGATPPSELLRVVHACAELGSDLAIASRYHPAAVLPVPRSRRRRLAAQGFAGLVRHLFALPYYDTQCGAKVIRRSAAQRITPLLSARDFVFDVDLLVIARELGFRTAEVPTVWLDKDGSRVRPGQDALRMAASLALLWARNRVLPIRLPSADVVTLPSGAPAREADHAA